LIYKGETIGCDHLKATNNVLSRNDRKGIPIMARIILEDGKYYFDAQDGSERVECPVWNEKSKASEAHPE
jgi:hypothetical protein